MAEIAQERVVKSTKRERKFRSSFVKAKEIVVRALEQERKYRIVLILSWFFFLFMLFSCFGSSENVGMMIEYAWRVVMYKQVLNCIVIELCKMIDTVGLKPLNNISFFKIKCYLC